MLGRPSKVLGKHIHHPLCGYGGERWLTGAPVDGYDPKTQTVYQYQGSYWHGCVHCFLNDRQKIINNGKTRDEAFFATAERTRPLREAGYRVIKKWECQDKKTRDPPPKQEIRRTPRNFLRFRIVPRQNAAELGDARPYLRKRTGANFGEPWRHAGPRAKGHQRPQPQRADTSQSCSPTQQPRCR